MKLTVFFLFLFTLLTVSASVEFKDSEVTLTPGKSATLNIDVVNDASIERSFRADLSCLDCDPSNNSIYKDDVVVISSFDKTIFLPAQQKTGIVQITALSDAKPDTYQYALRIFADDLQVYKDTLTITVPKKTWFTHSLSFVFGSSIFSVLVLFTIVLIISIVGLSVFIHVEHKPVHPGVFWTVALLSAVVLTTALRYLLG